MIRAKELRIYIEDMSVYDERMKGYLQKVDKGERSKLCEDSISFRSLDQLRKFLTPKRLELLRTIRHKEPKSIYELAKLVGRTAENVNSDIKFLKTLGFVQVEKAKDVRVRSVPRVTYDKMILEIAI